MEKRRRGLRSFWDGFKALSEPQAPKVQIVITEGEEVDFNQLKLNRARTILEGAHLTPRQREALEVLIDGERHLAHNQTNLAWQLTLASDAHTHLSDEELHRLRSLQEGIYEQTSEIPVTNTLLKSFEGKRDE